jgi:hypothetical protein
MLIDDASPLTVPSMRAPAKIEGLSSGEKLSVDEIWKRFPDEWVVLVDTEQAPNGNTIAGVVHGHSPKRAGASAISRGLRSCAIFWTGKMQSPLLWYMTHYVRRSV